MIFDEVLLDDIDEELDMTENYSPLPYFLTIKQSDIEGLGLFAKENIDRGVDLGVSHVHHHKFLNSYIRTPLGGFVNHSEEPNCKLVAVSYTHLRAHETDSYLVCRLLLEKKKK